MSNIFLKATIETFSKLRFSGFKKFVTKSVSMSSNSRRYNWILKLLVVAYKLNAWEQSCLWLFYHFNFERSYDILKSKSPCILLNKEKRRHFFVPFILSKGNFFKICVLSQCIVYWIHFQSIHTFTYQKALLHTLLLLVSKIVKILRSVSLSDVWFYSVTVLLMDVL